MCQTFVKMYVAEVNKMKEDWDAEYVEKDVEYICKKLEDVYREESNVVEDW